jgi:hypothetical protein
MVGMYVDSQVDMARSTVCARPHNLLETPSTVSTVLCICYIVDTVVLISWALKLLYLMIIRRKL